ncbi:MAG: class I SAM-dependent methyltransferase [Bacillota bacterium]
MPSYNFDRVSDQYDQTRGLPPGLPERIARWVLSRLPKDPAITELGVGTGRIAVPFIQAGVRYTGFDISEQMLERLRAKLQGEMQRSQIMLHDITQPLPLPDRSQDAVIAVHILHLVDSTKALEQVRRVLKPGGALVWGYEAGEEQNAHKMLRDRFHAEAVALGYHGRDYHAQIGRELLARWGAAATQHVIATWSEEESLQAHIDRLRAKVFSFTWGMTDQQLHEAAERVTAWAEETFGDLSLPRISERRFVIDWYVLGGT